MYTDVWLGPKQVAEFLGVHLSTVYAWARDQRGPPYYRVAGTRYRYRVRDLEQWLEEHRG